MWVLGLLFAEAESIGRQRPKPNNMNGSVINSDDTWGPFQEVLVVLRYERLGLDMNIGHRQLSATSTSLTTVQSVTTPTATTFRHKYVSHNGAISDHAYSDRYYVTITATNHVSDDALHKAALDVSLAVRHMPDDVFNPLNKSHGVGLFSKSEGMVVYPENAHLADTAACRGRCDGNCRHTCTVDGRKFTTIAGLTNQRSSVLDDNVLCDAQDLYRHKENLLIHEFGHLIMRYMPTHWSDKIRAAYQHAYTNRLWTRGVYGMANADEYWAEATSSFFMSILRTDVTGGMNMCGTSQPCKSEADSRAYLKQHDPQLFEVLSYAYTDNRPNTRSGLRPCI